MHESRKGSLILIIKKYSRMRFALVIMSVVFLLSCNNNGDENPDNVDPSLLPRTSGINAPANIPVTILSSYPHDPNAYTQGLELYNGKMYESTGDYENSSIRITDHKTGRVIKSHPMGSDKIFGEGLNILNGKVYQLTWQSNIVYVYDVNNIDKPIKTFTWPYDGWGITNNGKDLIISDGTANLYFVDPNTFKVLNTIGVVDDRGSVPYLNELEWIDGFIYANVYEEEYILKIDPSTGFVVGKISLPQLIKPQDKALQAGEVLNGIAWDSTSKTMFVTGKRWPKMFELKLN